MSAHDVPCDAAETDLPSPDRRFMEHSMTSPALDRELRTDPADPIGLDGIEFIEYTTPRPQALGQVLETMGFRPVARHRSREVTLTSRAPT
jgi:4-hydroxyphenylpyruvate dioxygenase-like putative hemolysin